MRLSPYWKRAIKWFVASLLFYAASFFVREFAWSEMIAGGQYAIAFILLLLMSTVGTIALAGACYFALLAV